MDRSARAKMSCPSGKLAQFNAKGNPPQNPTPKSGNVLRAPGEGDITPVRAIQVGGEAYRQEGVWRFKNLREIRRLLRTCLRPHGWYELKIQTKPQAWTKKCLRERSSSLGTDREIAEFNPISALPALDAAIDGRDFIVLTAW